MGKKIGILGGAFDPIHEGHLQICDILINDYDVDEIWFVPSFSKEKTIIKTSIKKRIKMLKIIIKANYLQKPTKINNFEVNQKKFVPTIKTLKHFKKTYPSFHFIFAFGSDYIDSIHKWVGFQNAHKVAEILCFPRQGYSIIGKTNNLLKIKGKFVMRQIVNASSTNIRQGKDVHFLHQQVLNYILKNRLYIKNWVYNMLDDLQKYKHSLRVAKLMVKYAKIHGLDNQEAYLAGLFHDICRNWDEKRLINYISLYNRKIPLNHIESLHQYAGAYYVKYEWGIVNDNIFNAIASHTTGSKSMSKLAKLLFTLDIYDSKQFRKSLSILEMARLKDWLINNVDKAFLFVLIKQIKWIKTKSNLNKDLFIKQKKILEFHLNEIKGHKNG